MIKAIIFLTKIVIAVFLSLLFVSCWNIHINDGVDGSGNVTTQSRSISESFTGVTADGGLEVVVEQGDAAAVTIEADDNIIPLIKTEVNGSILVIRTEGSYSTSHGPVITVRMPRVNELNIDGGSTLRSNGTLISENLKLTAGGGAHMEVHVEADRLTLDADGGAGIEINGKALDFEVSASGGSPVEAERLQANNVTADASGGASISVYPILSLKADASGGGSVGYHHLPKTITKSESGGGVVSEE